VRILIAEVLEIRRSAALLALLLASCARYAPAPLAVSADLMPVPPQALRAGVPLSVDDVVRLALEDNPGLRAARARRGIAQAQLLQTRILPNPSLAGSFLPLISGVGVAPAWGRG
jgi:outer membrane protein TolC